MRTNAANKVIGGVHSEVTSHAKGGCFDESFAGQRRKVRGQTGGEGGSLGVAVSEVGVRVNRSAGLAVPIYTITLTLTCTHI